MEAGVPQGGVLSPTLFNIMLHDLSQNGNFIIYSYADDITFSVTGSCLSDMQILIQNYLNHVVAWLERLRMSVSSEMSSAQLFTRLRGKSLEIKIHNSKLSCNKVQRLLGGAI